MNSLKSIPKQYSLNQYLHCVECCVSNPPFTGGKEEGIQYIVYSVYYVYNDRKRRQCEIMNGNLEDEFLS